MCLLLWDRSFCLVGAAVPHTATRSLQELRHESLKILPPRMAAVAYIRDRGARTLEGCRLCGPWHLGFLGGYTPL